MPARIHVSYFRASMLRLTIVMAFAVNSAIALDEAPMVSSVIDGQTMGTTYAIKLVAPKTIDVHSIQQKVDALLVRINSRFSTYLDDSEVSQFNQTENDHWFSVSAETAQLIKMANEISVTTNGAFDITVSPLVACWNFGAYAESGAHFLPPTESELSSALRSVGFQKLEVRMEPPSIRKSVSTVQIDLSGIAKGYAVDAVAQLLTDQQIDHYMIEIGGEIRAMGKNAQQQLWRIGIEKPQKRSRELQQVMELHNQSLATSGDYRNFFEHDNVSYSHTIDPQTGRPVTHSLASVSVVAADCTTADALATALLVMGPEKGRQWAEQNEIQAIFLSRSNGKIVTSRIGHFDERVESTRFSTVLLISIGVFAVALFGMAVGIIFSHRKIKGSCGGLAGLTDEQGRTLCDGCTNPSPTCTGLDEQSADSTTSQTSSPN